MSEYQFYEFRIIDRPLMPDEVAEVAKLSSRADVNQYQAIFVYNYGDFRTNPKNIDEPEDDGIEGEGWLSRVISLRQDILARLPGLRYRMESAGLKSY